MNILLVEDEADVLAVNQAILEELGYRLLTADDVDPTASR